MGSESAAPPGKTRSGRTRSGKPGSGRGIGGYLPYVLAAAMAVVLVVVTVSRGGPSDAAKDTLGGKQLKIMAPADPGGGWDSTARPSAWRPACRPAASRSAWAAAGCS